jgi:glyoxylase-like metal-dependent hydrolase (beta-lactamase superfamily II)
MPTCAELRGWLLACALLLGPPALAATPVQTPYGAVSLPFTLHKIADAPVYYIEGLSGVPDTVNEGHTSNAGFVVTPAGVVVFDALGTPALGYRLLQRIREVTDQPVKYVVVSHYHADHIYGLQAFKEHGGAPTVLAQRGTLGYAGGTRDSQGEDAQRRLEQRRRRCFPGSTRRPTSSRRMRFSTRR